MPWGQELRINGAGCNGNRKNRVAIAHFARELVAVIGMRPFGEPEVVHFAGHDPHAAGYTLTQLIETSLISAHFVDRDDDGADGAGGYLNVFSCSEFNHVAAIDLFRRRFAPSRANWDCTWREAYRVPRMDSGSLIEPGVPLRLQRAAG